MVIPSLQPGGMERVMSELAAFFCQKNEFEIHMVLYGKKPEIFYPLPEKLIVHEPFTPFKDTLRPIYAFGRLLYLRKMINKIKPGSILSFGEYWNSFVLIALIGLKVPIYISDRCQPDKSLGRLHDLLRRYLYPKANGIIVQTSTAKDIYQRMLPKAKLTIIGNPIRTINSLSEAKRENIVLSVGMLLKTKNFDALIKLFAELEMDDWKLVIVGDDALKQKNKERLKSLVKGLNYEDRIILTGLCSDVDIFYRKSKIFAFTSSSEGFPNVIGEAMSAGMPVIAFDPVAAPTGMVEDGNTGFLVPLSDYRKFKERLLLLMSDERLRQSMGLNAKKKIAGFSPELIGEKYFKFCTSN